MIVSFRETSSRQKTVGDVLAEQFPKSSRSTLKRIVLAGRVLVNGKPAKRLSDVIAKSDRVQVVDRPRLQEKPDELRPLERVFEDQDILVINKPAGLLTSSGPRDKRPTTLAIVQKYVAEREPKARVGLIHRLDRDASGLLVFSKSNLAYESLKTQFFNHSAERIYHAVVHGSPKPAKGRIESKLVEYADGTVHSTKAPSKGQQAVTEYEVLRVHGKIAELRVRLETGRKHQIRAHLSARGWPIVGDAVYGKEDGAARLMLAAVELSLTHPRTARRMKFSAEVPAELQEMFESATPARPTSERRET